MNTTGDSPLRKLSLAGTFLAFTAATFDDGPMQTAGFFLRFPIAAALLVVTLHVGMNSKRTISEAPRAARTLIRAAWLLVAVALALAPLAISPSGAAAQAGIFALLVANMHAHVTHRWHNPQAITQDMRLIFWTLAAPIVISLGVGGMHEPRLSGIFGNPNALAILAAMTAALGIGLAAQGRRLLYGTIILICVVVTFRTESRTALLAVAIAATFLAVRRARWQIPPRLAIAGCFAAATAALISILNIKLSLPEVFTRFESGQQYGPLNGRDQAWSFALDLWSRQPLTGYGFRVGEIAFQEHRTAGMFQRDVAHNSYVQLLLEVGILGYLPFLAMLFALASVVRRRPAGMDMGLVAFVIVGLATAITESYMFGVGQSMSWTFWLGAAAACAMPGADDDPPGDEPVSLETVADRSMLRPLNGVGQAARRR